jgi:DNA-binding HxlR family transcriptional regulator
MAINTRDKAVRDEIDGIVLKALVKTPAPCSEVFARAKPNKRGLEQRMVASSLARLVDAGKCKRVETNHPKHPLYARAAKA